MTLAVLLSGITLGPESSRRVSAQGTGPAWRGTGFLNKARIGHTATLLRNGNVLVVGGWGPNGEAISSAELYDPVTETWIEASGPNAVRMLHTATLLADGRVLIAGGSGPLRITELYDPITGTWSRTGDLNNDCFAFTASATLLPSGQVLMAGCRDSQQQNYPRVEIYNPDTGMWLETANFGGTRLRHTATLLPNGKVLVAGPQTAELYDPIAKTWSPTGNLTQARAGHTATLLSNGKVLLVNSDTAELYDPVTGIWRGTDSIYFLQGDEHRTATLLPDGKVLAAGFQNDDDYIARTQLYDPLRGVWNDAGDLRQPRSGHTATLLPNGRVLVAGGSVHRQILRFSELFDAGLPSAGTFVTGLSTNFSRMGLPAEAIVSSFGTGLATTSQAATNIPLPTSLAGTSVIVKDSAGIERLARLAFVSPNQVNYEIPPRTSTGVATVTITSGDGKVSTGIALISKIAPSLFTASGDGKGVAAALVLRVSVDGSQSYEPIAQFDVGQNRLVPRPLDLGSPTDEVFLILFGTGIRHRGSLSSVIAAIGEVYADISFAGAHSEFAGLDQVNVLLPRSLAGKGELNVLLTVEAQISSPVRIHIK